MASEGVWGQWVGLSKEDGDDLVCIRNEGFGRVALTSADLDHPSSQAFGV